MYVIYNNWYICICLYVFMSVLFAKLCIDVLYVYCIYIYIYVYMWIYNPCSSLRIDACVYICIYTYISTLSCRYLGVATSWFSIAVGVVSQHSLSNSKIWLQPFEQKLFINQLRLYL